jgi:hypothetical protein
MMLWGGGLFLGSWLLGDAGVPTPLTDVLGLGLCAAGAATFAKHTTPRTRGVIIALAILLTFGPLVVGVAYPFVVTVDLLGWFLTMFAVIVLDAVLALTFFITLAVGWSKRPRFQT